MTPLQRQSLSKNSDVSDWLPITAEMTTGGPWLVTNNLHAKNADGDMSHVWVTHFIQKSVDSNLYGEFMCFSGYRPICDLTHYCKVPAA